MSAYELIIGTRHLRSTHRRGFVSFVALMSVCGLMLGVATLIVVLSVMNGFERELKTRILSVTSHATITGLAGPLTNWQALQQKLRGARDVQAKPAALDEGDAALVAGVGRKRPAHLQRRKAQSPGEVLALCRRTRDLACAARTIAPWHGGVGFPWKIASVLDHATTDDAGVDAASPGRFTRRAQSEILTKIKASGAGPQSAPTRPCLFAVSRAGVVRIHFHMTAFPSIMPVHAPSRRSRCQ